MRSLIMTIVVGLGMTSVARAQDFEAAGKHFSAAQEAFGAKHYRTAAAEFEAAYGITKDPVLLYNIAESYEKAGDGHKAAASYKAYLKDQPAAADKAEVQKRIHAIETKKFKLVDQSAPGDNPPPTTTTPALPPPPPLPPSPVAQPPNNTPGPLREPPPSEKPMPLPESPPPPVSEKPMPLPESPPPPAAITPPAPAPVSEAPPPGLLDEGPTSKMRVAAWIGVAATLAVLTAGAIFGLAAESRSDEINRRLSFVGTDGQPHKFDVSASNDLKSLHDDGVTYNGLAIAFYSIAAASTIVTVTLFVVDAKRPHPAKHAWRIAPVVGKNVGGLVLGGTF
jgi:hypothetical protein